MVEVGSMEIVGLFKDMNLFSSLAKVKYDIKSVGSSVKSTTTEITRLSKSVKTLATGMVAIAGATIFASLLTSVPYLQGAFARISTDLKLLWWSLAKHLKPALDLVADAIHALRTGDWEGFKRALKGAVDLAIKTFQWAYDWFMAIDWEAVWRVIVDEAVKAWNFIKEYLPEWTDGFVGWLEELATAIKDHNWWEVWQVFGDGLNTVWDDYIFPMLPTWLQKTLIAIDSWIQSARDAINTTWGAFVGVVDWFGLGLQAAGIFWEGFKAKWKSYSAAPPINGDVYRTPEELAIKDVGGIASYTGYHWLKAGESVGMSGNTTAGTGGAVTITNDFNGATFNLSDGMDIDAFVEMLNQKQAEKARWEAF